MDTKIDVFGWTFCVCSLRKIVVDISNQVATKKEKQAKIGPLEESELYISCHESKMPISLLMDHIIQRYTSRTHMLIHFNLLPPACMMRKINPFMWKTKMDFHSLSSICWLVMVKVCWMVVAVEWLSMKLNCLIQSFI